VSDARAEKKSVCGSSEGPTLALDRRAWTQPSHFVLPENSASGFYFLFRTLSDLFLDTWRAPKTMLPVLGGLTCALNRVEQFVLHNG
jgi:hypothetical protein